MRNKRLYILLIIITVVLAIPSIAMQFTDEVKWTLGDFFIAGILLFSTGLMYELVIRKVKKTKYRIAICAALLTTSLLIWVELAVGVIGSTLSGL